MTAISIPRTLTKGEELVVIPRKVYESLIRFIEDTKVTRRKTLNKGLQEAISDVKAGRVVGPFSTVEEGMQFLRNAK